MRRIISGLLFIILLLCCSCSEKVQTGPITGQTRGWVLLENDSTVKVKSDKSSADLVLELYYDSTDEAFESFIPDCESIVKESIDTMFTGEFITNVNIECIVDDISVATIGISKISNEYTITSSVTGIEHEEIIRQFFESDILGAYNINSILLFDNKKLAYEISTFNDMPTFYLNYESREDIMNSYITDCERIVDVFAESIQSEFLIGCRIDSQVVAGLGLSYQGNKNYMIILQISDNSYSELKQIYMNSDKLYQYNVGE